MNKKKVFQYFNTHIDNILKSKKRNRYYYSELKKLLRFNISPGHSVLNIGCGIGELLDSVEPKFGVGIDISSGLLRRSKAQYPHLNFACYDPDVLAIRYKFDYIVVSNILDFVDDIQGLFTTLRNLAHPGTRIIILHFNYVWLPFLRFAELIRLKFKIQGIPRNWIAMEDIQNFIELCDMETIKNNFHLLMPLHIPLLSSFMNRFIANLPFVRHFNLVTFTVARFRSHVFSP